MHCLSQLNEPQMVCFFLFSHNTLLDKATSDYREEFQVFCRSLLIWRGRGGDSTQHKTETAWNDDELSQRGTKRHTRREFLGAPF